ncbi:MAG: hypothetical protein WA040_06980 [Anaerolineae bacterium]
MNIEFILIHLFDKDTRGPDLIRVYYTGEGSRIKAIDYCNPDDTCDAHSIRHLRFLKSQVHMFVPEEVYNYGEDQIPWRDGRSAAVCLGKSAWLESFLSQHLRYCQHYRLVFYDQILDIICEGIEAHSGAFRQDPVETGS